MAPAHFLCRESKALQWDILAFGAAAILCLAWQYRRDRERQRKVRGGFFANCRALLELSEVAQDNLQFPVLTGRYEGFDVKLEPIVDDMVVRKLPSLWLKVSLIAPVRYAGAFDLLIRPRGMEFFSPAFDLPSEVRLPPGWPADAVIRSDDPASMPPAETVAQHLHLFEDARMKELLIAPRGVRLIYQADQAERSQYAVLRQCKFSEARLAPDLARRLLDAVTSVYHSVAAASNELAASQPGGLT
jgi:hypothetical protein